MMQIRNQGFTPWPRAGAAPLLLLLVASTAQAAGPFPPAPPPRLVSADAEALREHAGRLEEAGRRDRSVMVLQQAITAWQAWLPKATSEEERQGAQERIDGMLGIIQQLRQRPLLDEAREERNHGHCSAALPIYDRYLRETPQSPDRTAVEAERAQCMADAARGDRDSTSKAVFGYGLVVVGVAAVAAGGALIGMASSGVHDAQFAPSLAVHDEKAQSISQQSLIGAVLCAAGGVAVLGGVLRLAIGGGRDGRRGAGALWVSPTAGGLAVGGKF